MKNIQYLIIVLMCMVAQGAWAQTEVSSESALTTAISGGTTISVKLTENIALSNYVDIPSSKTVTIDLNGHKLNRGLSELTSYGIVIRVENGGTLTVKDSGSGGTITGGYDATGGGICVLGTLNFESGTISGCYGTKGGAIYTTSDGIVNMTGGTISGNTSTDGGGIYNNGTLTISGGTITGNNVTEHGGGAVSNHGTLTVNGGSFTNNSTVGNGGGIWTNQNISMSGSVTIKDNTNAPNNLYLSGSSTKINVTGAMTGSNIYVSLSDYNRAFTSGFGSNNSGAQPSDFFTPDVDGLSVTESSGEAYISSNGGVLYMECSWVWNDEDDDTKGGYVVKTQKLATGVNGFHIETDQILNDGWYQFVGTHEYSKRIVVNGDVKFILYDDCNIEFKKGIHINKGRTLTIYCQSYGSNMGTLRCTGDDGSSNNGDAAIGGNNNVMGGNLVIHGGTITAKPSHNCAAGIGGGQGDESGMQSLVIYGGNITAEGTSDGAGIGGGEYNRGPSVTIYGGTVTAQSGYHAAGIGGGEDRGNSTIKIYGGTVTATSDEADTSGSGAGIGGGKEGDVDNPIYIYGGTVTATSKYRGAGIGGGYTGNVNNPIYIYGGTINATGDDGGAGIGGGYGDDGGGNQNSPIYIYGGTINATGGAGGAGIGGGVSGNGGTITIDGGTVYAYGGQGIFKSGAGIGGGGGSDSKGSGGTVTINGGYVEAWGANSTNDTSGSAGIGAGDASSADGGTVIINGGTVKVGCGTEWAVPIGGKTSHGKYVDKANITIPSDMMVTSNITGKAAAADRVTVCKTGNNGDTKPYVLIEACDHSGSLTCSDKDEYYHHYSCSYCDGYDEAHVKGDNNLCTGCGRELPQRALTFYEAKSDGSGYSSTGTAYYVTEEVQEFTFPECGTVPSKKKFVGWEQADSAPSSLTMGDSESTDGLYKSGDVITLPHESSDRKYYARYKKVYFSGGKGTSGDPFIISKASDLLELAEAVNAGNNFKDIYLQMTADLSFNSYTPVGTSNRSFRGTFDGQGHSISGINMMQNSEYQGVFGNIGTNGTVKNLTLKNSTIKGGGYVGGIAGQNSGTIENCHVAANVTIENTSLNKNDFGGIAGATDGTVSGCTSAAKVNCVMNCANVGGIVGLIHSGTVSNCLYLGSSVSGGKYVGAIVGYSQLGTGAVTSNFYTDGPKGLGGTTSSTAAFDTDGAEKGYTITSGTDGLTLDYGSATKTYSNNGIKAYSSGLFYGNKLYTGGTTEVTFTPTVDDDKTVSNVTSSAGTLVSNDDGSYTLTMDSHDAVIEAEISEIETISLLDGGDNTVVLAEYDGQTVNVDYDRELTTGENGESTAYSVYLPYDIDIDADNDDADDDEPATARTRAVRETGLFGDVNHDGKVNEDDVNEVANYIMGNPAVTKEDADVNGDQKVNAADIVAVINASGKAEAKVFLLAAIEHANKRFIFTDAPSFIPTGTPVVIVVYKGSLSLSAKRVKLKASQPANPVYVYPSFPDYLAHGDNYLGYCSGSFLNFRAFFEALETTDMSSYKLMYQPKDGELQAFPADKFADPIPEIKK